MSSKYIKTSVMAAIFGMSAMAHAETTPVEVDGSTINFSGQVVNTACALDVGSSNQNIDLGQVKSDSLATAGLTSTPVNVQIKLDDCATDTFKTASFAFTGQVDVNNPAALANADAGTSAAANVGVQMKNNTGTVVPFDGSYDTGSKLTLVDGTNYANYTAYMIATADGATPGSVASSVSFKIKYE
ncbi:fimbrial protein [Lelliottia wanjuensis]|uniref:fimbrial protein n=1 Tax=Lelliottia wanjuensis TaxID=3050585 RepID=UPI00254BCB9E|nr:fimbrial protein [Lelliottia sp. V104_15]MDK9605796.1 fimbrial protein [Lelliottia sp. V104_15]